MARGRKFTVCACMIATLLLSQLPCAWGTAMDDDIEFPAVAARIDRREAEGLIRMREEEKLARDIYLALYARWGKRVFSNIIQSEQRHMDAIKRLLDRYQLQDPAAGKDVGVFESDEIQKLYDDLAAEGSSSLESAFKVGVAVEKLDIQDLSLLLGKTDHADIRTVYKNLLSASRRHLKAFNFQIERL